MKISVILCTYNRARSLPKALESVALSKVPDFVDWEVLIVDNNSSDRTRQVAEEYRHRFPSRFRYIFESRQGKSMALNTGIHASNAEILAFMDDDVEVDHAWLYSLTKPLINGTWSGVGGRILSEPGFVPPKWMETTSRYALAPLAVFDRGTEAGELSEAPFGTNMAFRKEMFSKHGGFRTDLGPQPGSEIRSEDTEFGERLLVRGERFFYEPSALVYHSVPRERIRKPYFLTWWYDKARAETRQGGIPRDTKWYIFGVPLYLFRRLCVWTFLWWFAFNPGKRFSCKLNVWRIAGVVKECHALSAQGLRDKNRVTQDIGTSSANPSK
jgi:glycosyltransferase involved in cell wall biosynthesis